MKLFKDQRNQLMQLTFLNFIIIAATIIASGLFIERQTHQLTLTFLLVTVLLIAGLLFIPIVNRRAELRLEKFTNWQKRRHNENG